MKTAESWKWHNRADDSGMEHLSSRRDLRRSDHYHRDDKRRKRKYSDEPRSDKRFKSRYGEGDSEEYAYEERHRSDRNSRKWSTERGGNRVPESGSSEKEPSELKGNSMGGDFLGLKSAATRIVKAGSGLPVDLSRLARTNEEGSKVVFLSKKERERVRKSEEEKKLKDEQRTRENMARRRSQFQSGGETRKTSSLTNGAHVEKNGSARRSDTSPSSHRRENSRDEHTSSYRKAGGTEKEEDRNKHKSAKKSEEDEEEEPGKTGDEAELKKEENEPHQAFRPTTESALCSMSLLKLRDTSLYDIQNNLEQIREHYLGIKKEKRRIQKPSEKFRNIFNFEWSPMEDTTRGDSNVLYRSRIEPQLLFGRGFRAGIDVREQRRHNNFYDELIKRKAAILGQENFSATVAANKEAKKALIRFRDIDTNDPNKKHWTSKEKDEMTERDWRIFREDFEIYIKGGRVPPPIRHWAESELPEELLEAVAKCGYRTPTPIQMQAIPIALEQRDLIGIAETGSGKTAAFVLPLITYVKELPCLTDETSQDGPYALVLAPSRELAIQIDDETSKFASFCKCRTVVVVGGRSAETQAFKLRRGAEIVIGTPGRIKDCLEKSYTVLSQCNYVVLDEADRMIDLGFEEVVNWILDQIPSTNLKSEDENEAYEQEVEAKAGFRKYRLTHMFSATMPSAVERLARKYLRSPAYISIGDPGAGKRAIEQRLDFLPEGKKKQRLQEVLELSQPPIMVFVNQKKVADVLAKTLQKMNFSVASLHGGKAQGIREQSLHDFKNGDVDILVATDVAGRGIDVEGVQLVVNYDMPKDIGSYTHRIGRTGRAGKKGLAISFVTEDDSALFYDLRQLLISTNNAVPVELNNHPMAKVRCSTVAAASSTPGAQQTRQLR